MSTLETTKTLTTIEVANRLVSLCREGKNTDAIKELYAEHIVSLEPKGSQAERTEGKSNVLAKTVLWSQMVEAVHSTKISEPISTGNYFSCIMEMDVTMKGMGRMPMHELCVYEVIEGQIVFEQFFFQMKP